MSIQDELASLSHEDLVRLSSLVHKLLKWDCRMSWDEALQQAYNRVVDDRAWMKGYSLQKSTLC